MPTISTPGYPDLTPSLITGYAATRAGRNVVHGSISADTADTYVSFRKAALRTGTLKVLFHNQDDAQACFDRHADRLVFTIRQPQSHVMTMTYVLDGDMELIQDPDTRRDWTVEIPFHEVRNS